MVIYIIIYLLGTKNPKSHPIQGNEQMSNPKASDSLLNKGIPSRIIC